MVKILFTIINMNRGGAQRVLVNMVNKLDLTKYDVTILSINDQGDLQNELDHRIKYRSINRIKNRFIRSCYAYLVRRVIPPWITAAFFFRKHFDYEVAYLEGECTRLVAAHRVPKEKKIAWVHINLVLQGDSMKIYPSKEAALNAYKEFNRVICVSQAAKNAFIDCFGPMDSLSVVYNVYDFDEIEKKSLESIQPWRGPGLNMLMVGNFRKQKAYDRMINIAEQLKNDGLSFSLTILGDGPEFPFISQLVSNKHLSDEVQLLGAISNPYPYLKQADVLVCSSITEGFSTVVMEALTLDCPTITTDCTGMSEILDNGTYGIITENNESALYQQLKKVICSPDILSKYRSSLCKRKQYFQEKTSVKRIEQFFI